MGRLRDPKSRPLAPVIPSAEAMEHKHLKQEPIYSRDSTKDNIEYKEPLSESKGSQIHNHHLESRVRSQNPDVNAILLLDA